MPVDAWFSTSLPSAWAYAHTDTISRHHTNGFSMTLYAYHVNFTTPAFLGNAQQQAQWRTPPLKALLRQWWRVAVAQQVRYNTETLRQQENALFGTAADGEGDSRQSLIRIRLSHWNMGKLTSWKGLEQESIPHAEAEKSQYLVGPHAYLGYGPLDGRGGTQFSRKEGTAIQAGDTATFSLAFVPRREMDADTQRQHERNIQIALWLMDRYGTLGGRSRNGWGSLSLQPADDGTAALDGQLGSTLKLPWQDALQRDWPHALGTDAKGALVWQTAAFDDWKKLMQELARTKIALRTQFKFPHERPDGLVHDRHWLSYPVTTHGVKTWGGNARLPNSLRFKVRPAPGNPQQLVGVIFHVPCLPPPAFQPDLRAIERVWQTVHALLDAQPALRRIPA